MTAKQYHHQFEQQVFPAELREIHRRRAELSRRAKRDPEPALPEGPPTAQLGLLGLSLSGGGIRSATFSLGVIQALAQQGILKSVDYLSTVSGGGYIGSCLSSVLNTPNVHPEGVTFPLRFKPGQQEPAGLTHLRNSGNYLAPGGLLDKVRIPTLLLRGMCINLMLILPALILLVLVTEVMYEYAYQYGFPVNLFAEGSRLAAVLTFAVFLLLTLTFPLYMRLGQRWLTWSRRNAYERLFTRLLLWSLGFVALLLLFLVVRWAVDHSLHEVLGKWLMPPDTPALGHYWKWLILIALIGVFMLAGKAVVAVWQGKLLLLALGVMGPALLFTLYLLLCLWQIDSPFLGKELPFDNASETTLSSAIREAFGKKSITLPCTTCTITPVQNLDNLYSASSALHTLFCQKPDAWLVQFINTLINLCWTPDDLSVPLGWSITGTLNVVTGKPYMILHLKNGRLQLYRPEANIFTHGGGYLYGVALALFLFNGLVVNVNLTSAHGFYRDRLSLAYLFQSSSPDEIHANDRQRLSELNGAGTAAPYHLINVALNLQGSQDKNLRGRDADLFIFSKCFTGSPRTGFVSTAHMEKLDRHLNLGTALAISGAAAAPNMGTATVKPLVPLLTLLNIRLGYWLPHPGIAARTSWLKRQWLSCGAGVKYLWNEARGKLDARGNLVNISDGGHIENLGIYELLRRRCQCIIAVDAEADPEMQFGGLLKLIRYARIDLGIEIDIALGEVRKGPEGFSHQHGAVGRIHYGDGQVGCLLYIKSSLTGDEDYGRDYQAKNPTFPHESTSDQFFSETQFEVYRWLGYHAAETMFDPEHEPDIGAWHAHLGKNKRSGCQQHNPEGSIRRTTDQ